MTTSPSILYVANHGNRHDDDTEGHITQALRDLGCEVYTIKEGSDILSLDADWLLFHKWFDLKQLKRWHGKSMFWYFDKVDFNGTGRQKWMDATVPLVTRGFLTDGDWVEENKDSKLKVLRQGCGKPLIGQNKHQYGVKIAFTGSLYGERLQWYRKLEKRYTGQMKALQGVHNQDLYNACEEIPIFIAPPTPSTDKYWSSRVYMTLGAKGFLIHPYCQELTKEFKHKRDLVYYRSQGELEKYIDYYLSHPAEREQIRQRGFKTCYEKFSYKERCRQLLKEIRRA